MAEPRAFFPVQKAVATMQPVRTSHKWLQNGPKGLQKGSRWCGWCVVLLHLLRVRRREKLSEPFGNAPARRAARKKKCCSGSTPATVDTRPQLQACASHYPWCQVLTR